MTKSTKKISKTVSVETEAVLPEEAVVVALNQPSNANDGRFTSLENGKFSFLPSTLKQNEKLVEKPHGFHVEVTESTHTHLL
mgnify:CR=1 FL=1